MLGTTGIRTTACDTTRRIIATSLDWEYTGSSSITGIELSRILERVRSAASSYVTMEPSLSSHGESAVVCARHPAAWNSYWFVVGHIDV